MKSKIAISQFKARCLEIVKGLQSSGQTITITNRNQPVAEIHPINHIIKKSLFGMLQDRAIIKGNLLKPIGEKWNEEQE